MRNKNLDLVRAASLLLVVIYHIWVYTGSCHFENVVIQTIIMLAGEIGVTAFFILSGFGIYNWCANAEKKDNLKFGYFCKKRALRILPEYYLSLIIVIIISLVSSAVVFGGVKDLALHVTFLHNFDIGMVGSMNGVLWTMAVTVQFYLLAILLYKAVKKHPVITAFAAVAVTVVSKMLLLHYVWPMVGESANFFLSRQVLSSVIDNFVIGMALGYALEKYREKKFNNWLMLGGVIVAIVVLYGICRLGIANGIHQDNVSGYIWHTLVAVCVAVGCFMFGSIRMNTENIVCRGILFIAKHEYGIFIVHLVIMSVMMAHCTAYVNLLAAHMKLAWAVMLVIVLAAGIVYSWICSQGRKLIQGRSKRAEN